MNENPALLDCPPRKANGTIDHSGCSHLATPAGRKACRDHVSQVASQPVPVDWAAAFWKLWHQVEANRYDPNGYLGSSAEWYAIMSAEENADMTAEEQGFETHTEEWYKVAISGYESNMGR